MRLGCDDALLDLPRGPRRDCIIKAAIQFVMLSGETLAEATVKKPMNAEAPAKWRRWADKFREISQHDDETDGLASAAQQAYTRMIALHPGTDKAQSDSSEGTDSASTDSTKVAETKNSSPDTTMELEDTDAAVVKAGENAKDDATDGSDEAQANAVEKGWAEWVPLLGLFKVFSLT